jgi:hypothetical protein
MARRQEFNGQGKAIAAATAQTLTWTGTEISSRKTVKYVVGFTGAGNNFVDVTRIRLLANGFPIFNLSGAQLAAYIEHFSRSNFNLVAATATRFSIPLYLLDAPTWDMGDVCQFPMNAQVQLELQTGAGTVAGSAFLGWEETDIDAELMPKLLSSVLNFPASAAQARYNIGENGVVRAIGLNTVGVDQVRLVIAGESAFHAAGALFLTVATGDLSVEFDALAGAGVTQTDPVFHEITLGKSAPTQTSYVEMVTGATWAGATNEACIYAIAPNTIQPAAA